MIPHRFDRTRARRGDGWTAHLGATRGQVPGEWTQLDAAIVVIPELATDLTGGTAENWRASAARYPHSELSARRLAILSRYSAVTAQSGSRRQPPLGRTYRTARNPDGRNQHG